MINSSMDMNDHILLFDGECNLCNGLVQFVIRNDHSHKFRFAALQSPVGQKLLKKSTLILEKLDSVVYVNGEDYFVKSKAIFKIINDIGGAWKLLNIINILPDNFLDFCYDRIAKSRYRIFGKRNSCLVPTPELTGKFLA